MNGRKNDYTYSRINNLALAPHDFLIDCSENYHSKVNAAAKAVFDDTSKKIVMLAGPRIVMSEKRFRRTVKFLGKNNHGIAYFLRDFSFGRKSLHGFA